MNYSNILNAIKFENLNIFRYWSKKKLELFAKVENLGVFHIFWTLSCADYRFGENFTSFLQDEKIEYIFKDGQEEVLINDLSIEDYLSNNWQITIILG